MRGIFQKKLKIILFDLVFVAIGYICLFNYNKYSPNPIGRLYPILISVAIAVMIVITYFFSNSKSKDRCIYENKRALFLFLILWALLLILIFTLSTVFKIDNSNSSNANKIYLLLIKLGISLTLLICYFFKISLKEFNWNISIKSFAFIIILYIAYKFILNLNGILEGAIHINNILKMSFIFKFSISAIVESVYPGIYEEVLYRGFLISGLKGLGLSDETSNIVQAILFGISHVMSWGTASWVFLLFTASQAMMGYIFGKVYFKTKSLLPCILLHGLIDAVI